MHSTSFDPIDPVEPSIVARVREWTDQAVTPVDAAAVARAASSAATARVWHRGRWREALRVRTGMTEERTRDVAKEVSPMRSMAMVIVGAALAVGVGGAVLVAQQGTVNRPDPRDAAIATATPAPTPNATPTPPARVSVPWGSRRVSFTPPADWAWPSTIVHFGIHDVAAVSPLGCSTGSKLVDVGPSVDDLASALAGQTGLQRSALADISVGGYPGKRIVLAQRTCPPGTTGPDDSVTPWSDRDGQGLTLLFDGFAIVIMADVQGERLVFVACGCGHGYYGGPAKPSLETLAATADALAASIQIVDAVPQGSAWVTGTAIGGTAGNGSKIPLQDGADVSRQDHWRDMTITMSDPRLSGMLDVIYNLNTYSGAVGDRSKFSVGSGRYRIVNEAGSWEGPNVFLNEGQSGTATVSDTGVLTGSGAYEGLGAFLSFDFNQKPATVVGAIFPGQMPPPATFPYRRCARWPLPSPDDE
jgi:hypothetical protein